MKASIGPKKASDKAIEPLEAAVLTARAYPRFWGAWNIQQIWLAIGKRVPFPVRRAWWHQPAILVVTEVVPGRAEYPRSAAGWRWPTDDKLERSLLSGEPMPYRMSCPECFQWAPHRLPTQQEIDLTWGIGQKPTAEQLATTWPTYSAWLAIVDAVLNAQNGEYATSL